MQSSSAPLIPPAASHLHPLKVAEVSNAADPPEAGKHEANIPAFVLDAPPLGYGYGPAYLEGFWADSADPSADGYHGAFPYPVPHLEPWPGESAWLLRLRHLQSYMRAAARLRPADGVIPPHPLDQPQPLPGFPGGMVHEYGASACCRLCGKDVGALEYQLQNALAIAREELPAGAASATDPAVCWPESFEHYVDAHHVVPSRLFHAVVMRAPVESMHVRVKRCPCVVL